MSQNTEQLSKLAIKFYDVLTVNRDQLASFLLENTSYISYNTLSQLFIEIKKIKNYKDGNIVTDLLLGCIGPECNKQKAIYELPTLELLLLIRSIAIYLGIGAIEEIMAGQGLFSYLFDHLFTDNIVFNATDGICQCETSGNNPYYPIEKKNIYEYLIEKEIREYTHSDKKIYLTLWPDINISESDISEFIIKIKPEVFILVGQKDMYKRYIKEFRKLQYIEYVFTPHQLCFKDIIRDQNSVLHSTVTLFISSDATLLGTKNKEKISEDICLLANTYKHYDIFREKEMEINDKYILDFFSEQRCIPPNVVRGLSDTDTRYMIECLYYLSKKKEVIGIPEYLMCLDEFKFWYQLYRTNRFPKLLDIYERFIEFKNIYDELDRNLFTPVNVTSLKNKNVLPQWVNNKQDAIKCLILDYSTSDRYKIWKQSRDYMNDFYNKIFKLNQLLD